MLVVDVVYFVLFIASRHDFFAVIGICTRKRHVYYQRVISKVLTGNDIDMFRNGKRGRLRSSFQQNHTRQTSKHRMRRDEHR
jgi:hypothetical protein